MGVFGNQLLKQSDLRIRLKIARGIYIVIAVTGCAEKAATPLMSPAPIGQAIVVATVLKLIVDISFAATFL